MNAEETQDSWRQRRDLAEAWCRDMWGDLAGTVAIAVGEGGRFDESGKYTFPPGLWRQYFAKWPAEADTVIEQSLVSGLDADVYVSPLLRTSKARKKGNGGLGAHAWADLDGDLTDRMPLLHGLALNAGAGLFSSGRGVHVYLPLPTACSAAEIERWNRRLMAYLGADAKWSNESLLRFPGTYNHKPTAQDGSPPALVTRLPESPQPGQRSAAATDLDLLLPPDPNPEQTPRTAEGGARRVVRGEPTPKTVKAASRSADRSAALFSFVASLVADGASDAECMEQAFRHPDGVDKYGSRLPKQIEAILVKVRGNAGEVDLRRGLAEPYSPGEAAAVTLHRLVMAAEHQEWAGRTGPSQHALLIAHLSVAMKAGCLTYGFSQREEVEVAAMVGVTVRSARSLLVQSEWLERAERGACGKASRYTLNPDKATAIVGSHLTNIPVLRAFGDVDRRDVFRHGKGLGRNCGRIHMHLAALGEATAEQISCRLGLSPRTVGAGLARLSAFGLSHEAACGWRAIEPDWRALAAELQVLGRTERDVRRHIADRVRADRLTPEGVRHREEQLLRRRGLSPSPDDVIHRPPGTSPPRES